MKNAPIIEKNKPPKLSRLERLVLMLYLQFYSREQIADKLSISPHTVKTHLYNAMQKYKLEFDLDCEPDGDDFCISGKCRLVPIDEESLGQTKLLF